ncbi:TonB-dependent receptor [Sphingobacterium chungjuense]|uniref:TonB-dependent receptor n=1 Tax=Sphingobacterium chungjuense TaxID=2675553 RepID=UPI00140871AD|nr:TonB-dependent receptor [Sphingobacterium chungjuense]
MKKFAIPLVIVLTFLCALGGYAQSKVGGKVVDDTDKTGLQNATVMLLQAKDSILVDFTRVDESGRFSLTKSDSQDYLLMISYPKYGSFSQLLEKGAGNVDIGEVGLTGVANLIEEVMITGRIPVVIKGDTIEYDAGSFTTEKNAKVEDLLKVLPGITVDAAGKITAQGKTVEKVLLDGEEFFGDDPTLVTRNIRSDMVDKVQVYEKKSDLAERTGVDDGERIQTINVTLKEDAKNGMFGKVEGAVGNDDFYMGKVAVNKFKGSRKIAAYGLTSNDGTVSLGWQDEEKFGLESDQMQMSDDGSMMFFGSGGDEFSYWNGRGRPKALNTGVSFMDRLGKRNNKLNLSYKFGRIENNEITTGLSQQNLPNGTFNQNTLSDNYVENQRHRFNGRYDWNIDSLTTLIVKLSGTRGQRQSNDYSEAFSVNEANVRINDNTTRLVTDAKTSNITYDGLLTRKFNKVGRSLSLRVAGNVADDTGDSFLDATTNQFNADGTLVNTNITDQYKDIARNSNNLQTSATYTEPITDKWRTSIGYTFNNSRTHSINNSFNADANGDYTVFDEEFSNDFNFNTVRNAGDLSVGYKSDKIEFNFNNNLRNDDLFQRNNHQSMELDRGFLTYNPSARIRYNITKAKMISLNFNRNNILPSLTQIQPLRQNNDPLNIVEGNADLTPAQSNSYNLSYNSWDLLKNTWMFASVGFSQQYNAIQQNVNISESGVRTIIFDNMRERVNNNANIWTGMGRTLIKKYKIDARYGVNGNLNDNYNFLNGDLNRNQNYNYGFDLNIERNTTKTIDFRVGVNPGWRRLASSLQPQFNSSGFTLGSNLWFKAYLPWKIQLYGTGNYTYEAPTEVFDQSFTRFIFTPGVSKRFLKNETLTAEVYVNDVFNQNIGFSRFQQAGMISQQNYNTISRFFMVKVSWDFSMMGGMSAD